MARFVPPQPSPKNPAPGGREQRRPAAEPSAPRPNAAGSYLATLQAAADQSAPVRAAAALAAAARQRLEIRPLAPEPTPTHAANPIPGQPAPQAGLTVQCVGGAKFGLRAMPADDAGVVAEGLELLKQGYAAAKQQVKAAKRAALANFASGGQADINQQTAFTDALRDAELTPERLMAALPQDAFALAGTTITYRGVPVAEILFGAAGYVQQGTPPADQNSVYRRHTLSGLSETEYVRMPAMPGTAGNGSFLRRIAYRGITPPEQEAYAAGRDLVPANADAMLEGQLGYKTDRSGRFVPRVAADAGEAEKNDLAWLNEKAGTRHAAIPDDPRLLAFLQTRKGVNKLFSARSTGKEITSNHGATFDDHGKAAIDLAKVPAANLLAHYKDGGFDQTDIRMAAGRRPDADTGTLDWEVDRANESVLRNRELALSSIPRAAVSMPGEAPRRRAYEVSFSAIYIPTYREAFIEALGRYYDETRPIADPAAIPYPPYRLDADRAESDKRLIKHTAEEDARAAATQRVEYCGAYLESYANGWAAAYEDKAYDNVPEGRESEQITVPEPSEPKTTAIPSGTGATSGRQDGWTTGKRDGAAAGASHFEAPAHVAQSAASPVVEDDSGDEHEEQKARGKGKGGGKQGKGGGKSGRKK